MRAQVCTRQDLALPVTTFTGERFGFRCAFDRSRDSIQASSPGQDYLSVQADDSRIAFALCDGVSQSFYGDLAARILGDALSGWLWERGRELVSTPDSTQQEISTFLTALTETGSQQVNDFALDETLAPMLLVVLEKKRALGSEAIFTAGYLDLDVGNVVLCWMGDARLRLWDAAGEVSNEYLDPETFRTRERWSTRRGMIGDLHIVCLPLEKIARILTYSDGLARLDHALNAQSPADRTLEQVIEESKRLPSSDDISLLEIWTGGAPVRRTTAPGAPGDVLVELDEEARRLHARWQPVEDAYRYEVSVRSSMGWRIFSTSEPAWSESLDALPRDIEQVAVRCWVNGDAGAWSGTPADEPAPVQDAQVVDTEAGLWKNEALDQPVDPQQDTGLFAPSAEKPKRRRPKKGFIAGSLLLVLLIGSVLLLRFLLLDQPGSGTAALETPRHSTQTVLSPATDDKISVQRTSRP